MKKVFLAAFCITALCFSYKTSNAQTAPAVRIGVFDIDMMVQALPEYRGVDSLVQLYERDTLGTQYQIYLGEYQRLDSTFKADSASKKPQAVLDYTRNQEQQMAFQLTYWQQIAQNKSDQYRGQLLQPSYSRILTAYKKVLAARKYALIVKPSAIELGSNVENIFPLVAKEMNVTLPEGMTGDFNKALQDPGTGGGGGTGTVPKAGNGRP